MNVWWWRRRRRWRKWTWKTTARYERQWEHGTHRVVWMMYRRWCIHDAGWRLCMYFNIHHAIECFRDTNDYTTCRILSYKYQTVKHHLTSMQDENTKRTVRSTNSFPFHSMYLWRQELNKGEWDCCHHHHHHHHAQSHHCLRLIKMELVVSFLTCIVVPAWALASSTRSPFNRSRSRFCHACRWHDAQGVNLEMIGSTSLSAAIVDVNGTGW